jgi:hypothetical protein
VSEHSATLHSAATDHLPFFIAAPGEGDGLFNAMIVFLIVVVFAIGLFYLRLHALPEQMAHGTSKVQMQIVGVLALLALFTHNHIFWIGALLIALVQFPNFSAPLASMAQSLEKLAGGAPSEGEAQVAPPQAEPVKAVPTRKPPPAETERAPAVPERVA